MRLAQKIVAVLSIFAAFALFAVPTSVAEAADGGSHVCISRDGVLRVQHGTAVCISQPGNVAMAFGEGSSATAWFGTGNRAVARDGGIVIIVNADNNVGQADGPGSLVTIASGGQDNQITAINGGVAQYFGCTNLLLVADAGTNDFVFC